MMRTKDKPHEAGIYEINYRIHRYGRVISEGTTKAYFDGASFQMTDAEEYGEEYREITKWRIPNDT